jgi:hypothetical protein
MRFTAFGIVALLCSFFHSEISYGDEESTFKELETRLCKAEKQQRFGKHYNPQTTDADGVILGADALYWQARENGIPYAVQIVNPLEAILNPPVVLKSHIKELDFDWDFGVRVHAGLHLGYDGWGMLGTWTHFNTKAQDHGFDGGRKVYAPTWADPRFQDLPDFVVRAKAQWKLGMDQVDLMLSRSFYTGRYFILEPSIGVSAVWLDQHLDARYKRSPVLIPGFSHVKLENDFKGVGVRGGLDTRFCFARGWSLFNTTHLALYYGKFALKRKEKFITDTLSSQLIGESIKSSFWQVAPSIAMQTGFRWDYSFSQNRHAIAIKLACDYQIFFGQNQFLRIITTAPTFQVVENQGDLSLTGGTFSAEFTF